LDYLIRDLMTSDPQTVAAAAELDEAVALMDRHGIRHLPVLEADGRLVGMLSDRDLLFATGWVPADSRRERFEPSGEGRPRVVRAVMSAPAAWLGPGERAFDLALRIVTDRVGSVAVQDGGRLVGIATETDLLRAYARSCREVPGFLREDDTVARVMSAAPVVVHWSTTLGEAVEVARKASVRHLPVLDGGDLVGIVSDRDLRRSLGRGDAPEKPIEDIMTRDVGTASTDTTLCAAADLMCARTISGLPVVVDRELVGIVTTVDLACHCLDRFGSRTRGSG
jgi:CBS domain-containing protein